MSQSFETPPPPTETPAEKTGEFRRRYTRYPGNGRKVSLRMESGNTYTAELIDDSLGGFCAAFPQLPPLMPNDRITVSGLNAPQVAIVRSVNMQRCGTYYVGFAWESAATADEHNEQKIVAEFPSLAKRWRFYGDKSAWPMLSHAIRQFLYSTVEFDFGDVRRLARMLAQLLDERAPTAQILPLLSTLCERMDELAKRGTPS